MNDSKLGSIVNSEKDSVEHQMDVDRLMEWTEKWQMKFNAEKCEVIHFGWMNTETI